MRRRRRPASTIFEPGRPRRLIATGDPELGGSLVGNKPAGRGVYLPITPEVDLIMGSDDLPGHWTRRDMALRLESGLSIELVRVGPDDWTLWRGMRLEALREAPYAFSSKLADWQGEGDSEARWRARLSTVPFNLVSYLDRVEAGMVSATAPADDVVELISMWVAPFARGQGVGDALIMAGIGWAEDQRARRIALKVFNHNIRAIHLYRRHGFIDGGPIEGANSASPLERKMILHRGNCARQCAGYCDLPDGAANDATWRPGGR